MTKPSKSAKLSGENSGQHLQDKERTALGFAIIGNLFMAGAGILAAILSNSQAILLDGMFSMIGFGAAVIARRVSKRAMIGPDRRRPFGYALDEPIFTTFRSLSLLGLVSFAIINAVFSIGRYITGSTPAPLNYGPMGIYFGVICITCTGLWYFHWHAWRVTGRKSDILRLESTSFAFDGAITAAAGIGLMGIRYLQDGPLAVLAPIGDSIIVLFLCCFAIAPYFRNLKASLAELAGATAAPAHVATARRSIRDHLASQHLKLVDLSVMKAGRTFYVTLYLDPSEPQNAEQIDKLSVELKDILSATMGSVYVLAILSRKGRV